MIRLIQRKLIIPRGDTGSFSVPTIAAASQGDVAVFTIFDCLTRAKVFQKTVTPQDSNLVVEFTHNDTVNLPPGRYVWDIKFYVNPQYADDELVNGDEINSYYAGYSLPDCEIRETGDDLLTIDGSPETTLTPEALDILSATLTETTTARDIANEAASNANISAETASEKASEAAESATEASNSANAAALSASTASTNANAALAAKTAAETAASNAATSAQQAEEYAGQITGLSATAQTLNPGSAATASYDAATGILGLGIPKGATFTPTIAADGTISWTNDGSLPNPASTNIHGRGITNIILNNDYTLTIFFNDNTSVTTSAIRGATGNGIQSIEKTGTSGLIDTYTITYTDGETSSFTINNGTVPTFSIGTVTEGATAAATITGTPTNPILNLTLPNANVPTNVSAFTNDAGYLTAQDISGKQDTLTFDTTPTQNSTNPVTSGGIYNAIANINTMNIHICAQGEYNAETGVPTIQNPDTSTFYLVPGGEGSNLFIEWAYVNSAWERFGSADVDLSDYVQKTDYATSTTAGVIKVNNYGLQMIDNGDRLALQPATIAQIKGQASNYLPIVPTTQHAAVFYGLATAAGDSSQVVSNNEVGTYTNNAKTAIQTMLNVPAKEDVPIKVSDLTNDAGYLTQHQDISGKANSADLAAIATSGNYNDLNNTPSIPTKISDLTDDSGHYTKPLNGIPKTDLTSDVQTSLGKADTALQSAPVTSVNGQTGAVVLDAQDVGAYEKPATGIPASDLASGVIPAVPVQDVQVNGVSVVSGGVANVPKGTNSAFGVLKTPLAGGTFSEDGSIYINAATSAHMKAGSQLFWPVTPGRQHESVFYGLAKAAGADMASLSSTTVGIYPEAQKSAISQMLNSPVTVSGSTPTITALPGVRYVCGEVATLDITLPASGCVDVVFESGSTPTVLTITPPTGVTVKWANGFDPTALDANTTYEINIADGLGVAGSWT